MDKNKVEPLSIAYRLINPGCVVLISVGDGQRDNLFTVAWNMPISKDPPLLGLVSGKKHFSYPLIARTKELAINVPDGSLADALLACGTTSGRDIPDKFAHFGLTRQGAERIKAPLVAEAIANLECQVDSIDDRGGSALIIVRVVAARAARDHFTDGHWTFDHGLELIHHLSGPRFCLSARAVTAREP